MTKLKVYGERNTGTQLMRAMLLANGHDDLWPGTIAELGEWHQVAEADKTDWPASDRMLVREATIDDIFTTAFSRTLGWKHGATDLARLEAAAAGTTFVVTVKNPYAWVASMYRRPHHNLLSGNMVSIEDFVSSPWITCGRDNVRRRVSSIVELWNLKYRAWLSLEGSLPLVVMRYEDLMTDPDATLPLRRALGRGQEQPWSVPTHVPNNPGALPDYQAFYGEERWRKTLTGRSISLITAKLDRDLLARLTYDTLS